MAIDFNPFRPTQVAGQELFTGRVAELEIISSCLQQTLCANATGFFLTGERGIGKSSLLMQTHASLKVKSPSLAEGLISVLITIDEEDTALSFTEKVISAMWQFNKSEQPIRQGARDLIGLIFRIETPWFKILPPYQSQQDSWIVIDDLAERIKVGLHRHRKKYRGFVLLIDEVERASSKLKLGALLRRLIEQLAKIEVYHASIGLAGQLTAIDQLKDDHASVLRTLRLIKLDRLKAAERYQALRKGIAIASSRNRKELSIDDLAAQWIVETSDGYPHFLQQLASSALEADTDNRISLDDAWNGAFASNGGIDQLGHSYFEGMFNRDSNDLERQVLNTLAKEPDEFLDVVDVSKYLAKDENAVRQALESLLLSDILERHEIHFEKYRLVSRAFATWIQIRKSNQA